MKISNFLRFESTAASIFHYMMMAEEEENYKRDSVQITIRNGCLLSLKHRSYSGIFTLQNSRPDRFTHEINL